MNPSEYRREYAEYCRASERERRDHHANLLPAPRSEPLRERYSHLWRREEIEDLRRALEETPDNFLTERAGLRALANAARLRFAEERGPEVAGELSRCESRRIEWAGESVSAEDAAWRLSSERDAGRRGELAARMLDAVRACDDLRAELLASQDEAARELGFADYLALREEACGASFEKLSAGADSFLRRTGTVYHAQLARWAARELPPAHKPDYADLPYFRRASHLDASFPARGLRATYEAALASFGVRAASQKNVRVDEEARPGKKARTACFGVAPPDEVSLVVGAGEAGALLFRSFFRAGGAAQQFAWASRELASRHPEFIHGPDAAAREGFGLLLRRLFCDAAWLAERRALKASEAEEVARSCALVETEGARLCGARLGYALALRGGAGSEQMLEAYASSHTEATGFRHHAATSLRDAPEVFRAAEGWRANLFAAALGEYLRGRHGRRWWASKKAGDELIDVWNTASRYPAEELAQLIGAGGLDAELLADMLLAPLSGT
ncbi:MAG TPA: hypothetical protein VGV38_13385 [Pyrinomonadaceae bacterium]|nr:hypothetical protein [Pyrinomonadaceae bacterium]